MSREIKFRAWNGEQMVSPDYITRDGIGYWKEDSIPSYSKELMQFTGLKDKNGVDIYEADTVKCQGHKCTIQYRGNFCDFVMDMNKYGGRLLNITKANVTRHKIEIIGNIHETKS
jgi:uncharacterized phage protein (TIGR01671 family)